MKKSDWTALALSIIAFAALRGSGLLGPFVLPFETAFQEAIALHHLDNGILANRLLPVFAAIDGVNFYHTAHPPLLHIIYALLYKIFGVNEWVTRLFSLTLWTGSAILWRSMLGEKKHGWVLFPLAFLMPVPFILSTTTNYEMLSIFFVSLIGWLVLTRNAGIKSLLPVLIIGMLVDWPVYLAVPALIILNWKNSDIRKRLFVLFGIEVVFFAFLQGYQYMVAGEAAFFSHAPERANPFAAFSPFTWMELGSHFIEVAGLPVCIISSAATVYWLLGRPWKKSGQDNNERAGLLFALFSIILILSAPGLVSRHYVYLLYFVPVLIFIFISAINRAAVPAILIVALLLLFGARDYVQSFHRNPSYFAVSSPGMWWNRGTEPETAFVSSAVGTWKYYAGVETVHPLSAAAARWLEQAGPDVVQLDMRHHEVGGFAKDFKEMRDEYGLFFSFPGEEVYYRDNSIRVGWRPVTLEAKEGEHNLETVFLIDDKGDIHYALAQPPGQSGSVMKLEPAEEASSLLAAPAIVHSIPVARTDGVTFNAVASYDMDGSERLVYSRFVAGPDDRRSIFLIHLEEVKRLELSTTAGPYGNASYDDAYWLDPFFIEKGYENVR